MYKISVKQIVTSKWLVKAAMLALFGGLALPGPVAAGGDVGYWLVAPAKTLATGQAQCWDASGNPRDCANTGEDGEYRKGVKPVLGKRFKDLQNGTVVDLLTGLIWLKNANCANTPADWQSALDLVAELKASGMMNSNPCGDTSNKGGYQTDWRLPNLRELQSLVDYGHELTIPPTLVLPVGYPFENFQLAYWSSTSTGIPLAQAWWVNFGTGGVLLDLKNSQNYVLAVRGGL